MPHSNRRSQKKVRKLLRCVNITIFLIESIFNIIFYVLFILDFFVKHNLLIMFLVVFSALFMTPIIYKINLIKKIFEFKYFLNNRCPDFRKKLREKWLHVEAKFSRKNKIVNFFWIFKIDLTDLTSV